MKAMPTKKQYGQKRFSLYRYRGICEILENSMIEKTTFIFFVFLDCLHLEVMNGDSWG